MKEYGAMILRVTVGGIYLMSAYVALFVVTPRGMAAFLAKSAGLPTPTLMALVVIVVHGVGGGLLVLGVWSRLAASANAVVLLLGGLTVYLHHGGVLKGTLVDVAAGHASTSGYEYFLLLIAATLAVALGGPGVWAVGK